MFYTKKRIWIGLAWILRVVDRIIFRVQNGYYRCLKWIALLGFMDVGELERTSLRKIRLTNFRRRWAENREARTYHLRYLRERLTGKAK